MSKNLENEYKDLMACEASKVDADALWNRIESALPEKKQSESDKTTNNITDIKYGKKKFSFPKAAPAIGTLVAACILLFLVTPGIQGVRKNSNQPATMLTESAANNDYAESETCEAAEESVLENKVHSFAANEEVNEEVTVGAAFDGDMAESAMLNDAFSSEKSESAEVQIGETTEFAVVEKADDLYKCIIVTANNMLEKETEIFVSISDTELAVGETYKYALIYVSEREGISVYSILE